MSRWSTARAIGAICILSGVAAAGCSGVHDTVVQTPALLNSEDAANGGGRVYISARTDVEMYKYAQDYYLGKLTGFQDARGLCADAGNDVYVTNFDAADVLEFAPRTSKPREINDVSPYPLDCALDPTNGNLAVVNEYGQTEYSAGNVAIFKGAKGNPKIYRYSAFVNFTSCAFDANGDLLVTGIDSDHQAAFAYLPAGGKALEALSLQTSSDWSGPSYVRWDGQYFVVDFIYNEDFLIFARYAVTKQSGTQKGTMSERIFSYDTAPFWVGKIGGGAKDRKANAIAAATMGGVFFWKYPSGTLVERFYYGVDSDGTGITVTTGR
jgi:hypothetical protein